jgi:diguanylate cyclase (GGDEF)-like protein/PAS domain S-box-containing protein
MRPRRGELVRTKDIKVEGRLVGQRHREVAVAGSFSAMKRRSLSHRTVQLAFGSAIAILLAVGAFSHRSLVASSESTRWVRHTHEVLENLQEMLFAMEVITSTVRRFVMTGEDTALEASRVGKLHLAKHEAIVRDLTLDNPEQQRRIPMLAGLAAQRLQRAESFVKIRQEQGLEAAIAVVRGGPSLQASSDYQTIVRQMQNEELRLLALRESDVKRHLDQSQLILMFGMVLGALVTGAAGWTMQRDSTRREDAEAALFNEKERAQVTLNSIGDAVACTDVAGNLTFLNGVAEKLTGWPWQEAAGRRMADVLQIIDDETRKTIPDPMERAVKLNRSVHLPPNCILIGRDGVETPIEDSVAPIHDRQGRATGAVMVFRDVTVAREMALQVAHAATHDFLTGLPNRMLLDDRISQAIALAPRRKTKIAILFLDLDGFKHINDSLGHALGDRLLQSVAKRLEDCVRGSDTVSRRGGDEFVVLLSELQNLEDAEITARRMLEAVAKPHAIDHHMLHVTTSIGVSVYPDDGLDAEALIKNADTAMYQAKKNGRERYQLFNPVVNAEGVVLRSA